MKLFSASAAIVILCLMLLSSCTGGVDKSEYDRIVAERDSIANVATTDRAELEGLNSYIDDIAGCIDSISSHEQSLFVKVDPETGRSLTRNEIRERVRQFGEIIARQRQRLAMMEDSLSNTPHKNINNKEIEKLSSMIAFLNAQLAAKETEMNKLRAELASSKRSVEELTENVTSLKATTETLTRENEDLDRTVAAQTEKINEGYLLIRTKKELEEMGVLKGGFLKKTKFDVGNVDIALAQKVDKRHFNEVNLPSGKPKLLSQAPADSYTFEKIDKKTSKFIILDTAAFWSLSMIAIIQL